MEENIIISLTMDRKFWLFLLTRELGYPGCFQTVIQLPVLIQVVIFILFPSIPIISVSFFKKALLNRHNSLGFCNCFFPLGNFMQFYTMIWVILSQFFLFFNLHPKKIWDPQYNPAVTNAIFLANTTHMNFFPEVSTGFPNYFIF